MKEQIVCYFALDNYTETLRNFKINYGKTTGYFIMLMG